MSIKYGIKEVGNIRFVRLEGGIALYTSKPTVLTTVKPPEPVYYLVKLDREVSDVHHQYFRGIGIQVVVSEVNDEPNWMVVRLYPPNTVSSITDLEHVLEVQKVILEIG